MSTFLSERVSREVLNDPDVKHALHGLVEQLNNRIDVEHFGGESSTRELVEREYRLRDGLEGCVLGMELDWLGSS